MEKWATVGLVVVVVDAPFDLSTSASKQKAHLLYSQYPWVTKRPTSGLIGVKITRSN
jgi:hypothetical protein